ncbi:MAG: DUF4102 domain-containing protein [Betaproteobacteria bacterium]|nr:DUF4102 domain-containing protein [Betaproteobacteria bacterium]
MSYQNWWSLDSIQPAACRASTSTSPTATPDRGFCAFRSAVRRREMGLGPYPEVSHVQAKDRAKAARDLARQGVDPIDQARKARSALAADRGRQLTFDQCAEAYIAAHAAGWRNAKHGDLRLVAVECDAGDGKPFPCACLPRR